MRQARLTLTVCAALLLVGCVASQSAADAGGSSGGVDFRVEQVADGFVHPWAIEFLPSGAALVTERPGRLWILDNGTRREVSGLPEIAVIGQGGLLDIRIDPDFDDNEIVYYSYSTREGSGYGTAVDRARLSGTSLVDRRTIFTVNSFVTGGRHFGSRIVFDSEGNVLITVGDRGLQDPAQDTSNHLGTTIRIAADGGIPSDNPFVGDPSVPDEIYSYGHRNAQGMVVDPRDGTIWQHEHGPRGGDEVNTIRSGANYGWPAITYGRAYSGGKIGQGTAAPGMEQPVIHWTPSIAPSGMELYLGDLFPQWRGDLFVGALAGTHLRRLVLDGESVVRQEVLLDGTIGRIRDVAEGPDGALWLLTDAANGGVHRIVPE